MKSWRPKRAFDLPSWEQRENAITSEGEPVEHVVFKRARTISAIVQIVHVQVLDKMIKPLPAIYYFKIKNRPSPDGGHEEPQEEVPGW